MTRHGRQLSLTSRQRRLLELVRSFGPRGASAQQLQLRGERWAAGRGRRR